MLAGAQPVNALVSFSDGLRCHSNLLRSSWSDCDRESCVRRSQMTQLDKEKKNPEEKGLI